MKWIRLSDSITNLHLVIVYLIGMTADFYFTSSSTHVLLVQPHRQKIFDPSWSSWNLRSNTGSTFPRVCLLQRCAVSRTSASADRECLDARTHGKMWLGHGVGSLFQPLQLMYPTAPECCMVIDLPWIPGLPQVMRSMIRHRST